MRILASGLPEVSDCVCCVYELSMLSCAGMRVNLACALSPVLSTDISKLPLLSTDISKLPLDTSCDGEVGLCGTEG